MKLFFYIFLVALVGCNTAHSNPMQGSAVEGQVEAYTKMCLREPASVLCPHDDFFVTNSDTLNQQWCDLCAKDSSYSWCKHFPDCVTVAPVIQPQEEVAGETMQGKAVRLRAQAYEDLCKRTPTSVLCSNNRSN